jgi:membrane-associated phospholipid phosphatase
VPERPLHDGSSRGHPIALSFPQSALGIVAVWLLVAWSRLSLAHHYPTDIVLGAALGAGVSLAVCAVVP